MRITLTFLHRVQLLESFMRIYLWQSNAFSVEHCRMLIQSKFILNFYIWYVLSMIHSLLELLPQYENYLWHNVIYRYNSIVIDIYFFKFQTYKNVHFSYAKYKKARYKVVEWLKHNVLNFRKTSTEIREISERKLESLAR